MTNNLKIVIGSAGRRVYLVRWFQEAMRRARIQGEVYVFENDKNAASVAVADGFLHMPRYEDPGYRTAFLAGIRKIRPQLFFSLNDYELTQLAGGFAEDVRELGVVVPSLGLTSHKSVADKFRMSKVLIEAGISTPHTALLSDSDSVEQILETNQRVIVKDRFGSGSSGLQSILSDDLRGWLSQHRNSPDSFKQVLSDQASLVIQPELPGQEFGLDIVTPLAGGPVEGVLARRKLAMRGGETNVAVTVSSNEFTDLGDKLAGVLRSQGLIDVDVMQTEGGHFQVIDVNPRFGGGYPFSHSAGADVPSYYVASIAGIKIDDRWKQYQLEHKAAKYEEAVAFCRR